MMSKDNDITLVCVNSSVVKPEDEPADPDVSAKLKERQCHVCQKIMKSKQILKAHMAVHQDRAVKCDECGMMFTNPNGLRNHKQRKHMDESLRPFPCHMCERRFMNKSHLAAHVKTHTGERDVTCGLCSQAFYSKVNLVRHMRHRHLNSRSFQCHLCSRDFSRKSYVKRHLHTVHMACDGFTRVFPCRYCKQISFSRTSCYTHESTHNGKGAQQQRALCMICGKTFSRPSGLKKHMEKHNGPPSIHCEHCERPFYHSGAYKRHLLTHNRPDPDICQVCGNVYTNQGAFRRHLKRHVARGDLDQLPPVGREMSRISKMAALISQGADPDEILKTCDVEVVELGGKNNSNITRARNRLVDEMIEKTHRKDKWILDVDKINKSVSSHVIDDWMNCHRVLAEHQFPTEPLAVMHHMYSVISDDFKSIVLNHALVDALGNDSDATRTSLIFSLKSCLGFKDVSDIFQKDISVALFSPVPDIDIPKYVEEIPEIKQELLSCFPQVLFTCVDITVDTEVAPIDLTQDVYLVSIALDRNMREVLKRFQILAREHPPIDLEKGFDAFDSNAYAPLLSVRSTEKNRDFSEFRDMKQNIVEWTDEELQVKIANILNGKSRVFWINNSVNFKEVSERLNEIVAQTETFTYEEELEQEAEVDDPDIDDFTYEDTGDHVKPQSDSEPELKPVVDLIEPKVEPDVPDGYDENKENKKKRKKKQEEVTDSEEEEYVEFTEKKRGRKKKMKVVKTTKKNKIKEELKEVVDQIDEKKYSCKNVGKTCVEFICFYCNRHCASKDSLKCHIQNLHMQNRSCSCDICGKSFINKSRLETHIELVHLKIRKFQCASCEWSFYSLSVLKGHERRHSGIKPFMCHHCSKTFVRKSELKTHLVVHTGERNFVCNICGKASTTNSALYKHMKRHTNRKKRKGTGDLKNVIRQAPGVSALCNQCGSELSTPHSLKRHIRLVHEQKHKHPNRKPRAQKQWRCPCCELSFSHKTTMQRHMILRHPDNCDDIEAMKAAVSRGRQRNIPCPICKHKFRMEKGLQMHMTKKHFCKTEDNMEHSPMQVRCRVTEDKPKPWQCPCCELSFCHKTTMQRHMYKNHENSKLPRTQVCPVCGRRLLDEICVLRHMILRHPYNCDNIEAMKSAVSRGMRGKIPCPICKCRFRMEKGLQKHMAKKHFYKTEDNMEQLLPLPPVVYSVTEDKPNLLLL